MEWEVSTQESETQQTTKVKKSSCTKAGTKDIKKNKKEGAKKIML